MSDKLIESIKNELPSVTASQINQLINFIQTTHRQKNLKPGSLNTWIPSRQTVLKVLNMGVRVVDFEKCIETFKEIALERNWTLEQSLDFKFISHVKILISSGQVHPDHNSDTYL
ncbi:hypothetical protein KO507_18270 [Gilvimarinus agarilyticus]|uniref:hypothetical protein n=1 Tax=Gilvimarinus sp. 2_MG-2023 TaxID=3062666 RepID=UPI001C090DF1|nr:hypothetical protein [Gilvimarinus sp. 2_MG-2023]MBU2887716.1 hypothetical protein [Gilvimarinus agarilyticus]MDO6572363.1 hypothetical protein [Gilvimarinus sp. 2_MG-2023]